MITAEDAIKLLQTHDTLSGIGRQGLEVYHSLSHQQAQEIAELIRHLENKCNLEDK